MRANAFDFLEVFCTVKDRTGPAGGEDSAGQNGSHPGQKDKTITGCGIDGQRGRKDHRRRSRRSPIPGISLSPGQGFQFSSPPAIRPKQQSGSQ